MAHAERQIFERVRVTRSRIIPLSGEVIVKKGDAVNPGDLVAKAETVPGDPYVLDLQAELGVKLGPEAVGKLMLKRIGDRVMAKEPIARLKVGVFGDIHEALSPVEGVIEFISHAYARVLIREDAQKAAPVVIVNVAKKLDVSPFLIRAYMRCSEGDEVRQGTIIADAPGGVGIDYCYAPATGIIEKVCSRTGTVTILRPAKPTEVDAYLTGRVTELIGDRGASVETTADFIQGMFGLGFENYGRVEVVAKTPDAVVVADDINPEMGGAVLVGGANVTFEALRKALDGGVKGFVTGGANHADLARLLGKDIGVGITGQEDLAMTVILTEGFGTMPMASDTFELLAGAKGRLASVNGSTQVRAGVIRPEIIIPHPIQGDDQTARSVEECLLEREHERGEATVGSKVRIVRDPKFGQWGKILTLPDEPVLFPTEARLPAAEVELEDGSRLYVPLANLEVF